MEKLFEEFSSLKMKEGREKILSTIMKYTMKSCFLLRARINNENFCAKRTLNFYTRFKKWSWAWVACIAFFLFISLQQISFVEIYFDISMDLWNKISFNHFSSISKIKSNSFESMEKKFHWKSIQVLCNWRFLKCLITFRIDLKILIW